MSEQNAPKTLPRPSNYDDLFPGRFMKAGAMRGKDVTLTIDHVELEILPGEKGEEVKAILHFRERTKLGHPCQHVPSKTNGECIKAMFGKNLNDWNGKRVTFYPTTDKLGKETVDAIRVRGSPDIKETFTFSLKLPRKKARPVTMQKTGGTATATSQAAPTEPTPEGMPDEEPPPGECVPNPDAAI
jgi:hypothetical protein